MLERMFRVRGNNHVLLGFVRQCYVVAVSLGLHGSHIGH